jgi:hypothetical protein
LRSHLAGLATLLHKVFGIVTTETGGPEEFNSLVLEPHFELELGGNRRREPTIPLILRFLPNALVRPWFRNYLYIGLQRSVSEHEASTIRAMQKMVDECVRMLGQKVSAHAAKSERHASDVLSSKSRKQTGYGSGTLNGEKAHLYRRGMQSLDANFAALREHVQADLKAIEDDALISVQPISSPSFKPGSGQSTEPAGRKRHFTRGCPVCDHLVTVSKQFFAAFQFSLYNDERQQRSFAENGGFCPFHLWQLESISSPVGFSVGVAKLVKRIARLLEPSASIKSAREIL